MRRAAKRDSNHAAVVRALEAAGCVAIDLAALGGGVPDLLVYRKATGLLRLIEIKNPERELRKNGQPTGRQSKTRELQAGFATKVPVWRVLSVEEALAAMCIEVATC